MGPAFGLASTARALGNTILPGITGKINSPKLSITDTINSPEDKE
jgi:hypothetical protein